MWEFLNKKTFIGDIEIWRILAFFGVVLLSLLLGRFIKILMDRYTKRSKGTSKEGFGVLLQALAKPVVMVSFVTGFWFALEMLAINGKLTSILRTIVDVLYSVTIGYALYSLVDVIDYYLNRWAKKTESKVDDMLMPLVGKSIRITILVLVVIQIIQSISNKPVTSILAGLGVGGLAIALAGQDTIKNFFGSLVIVADKPFEIGDRIVVDGYDGPVENVGFRSTKLSTLDGHQVTVPNSEMVNKTIRNISKRPFIKHVADFTITYNTPPDKVERAVEIIKEILSNHEGMKEDFPPRVYFNAFNDWSLNILVIYWYHPPDYWKYMEFSERTNMEILKRFNSEGIEFAFPTQSLYIENSKV